MNESTKFGKLKLSIEGTNNGRGFDILYDFGKSIDFAEFKSKPEFNFIQPWMQFPHKEYTDTCKLVSIELVKRFNEYDNMKSQIELQESTIKKLLNKLESITPKK